MDSKSQPTVDIISKVLDGKIAIDSATQLLQKSQRTVEHYLSFYRKEGNRFAVHGNKGRAQTNKIPEPIKKDVQNFFQMQRACNELGIEIIFSHLP